MRSTALFAGLLALASTALAADKCNAQNIVDACVSGYEDRIAACQTGTQDWICLCDVYKDVLTCYNNCPDSNEKPPVQNQVTQFCTAAEPLRAASLSSLASVRATASSTAAASTTPASATGSSTATGSAATASAPAFSTGGAVALTTPAGAAIVALFAAAGLF